MVNSLWFSYYSGGDDAQLLSSQLNRIAKRAGLGLARTGSHARTSSGEIIIAFSTGNHIPRSDHAKKKSITINFMGDIIINKLYEATLEATEEAVINAIFCSSGMTGQLGRYCPPVPHEEVLNLLK
jgi:L-aminopeptidase/D-esterase-like protein